MIIKIVLILYGVLQFPMSNADDDEEIFTDYCQSGLCKYTGGDGAHTGCKNGVRHDGKFQYPPCPEDATLIPLTDREKEYILRVHNVQRNYAACGGLYKDWGLGPGCRHGVITWDKELEKTAYLHTSYCTFEHDKCRNTLKYPFSGQNLGIITYEKKPNNPIFYINIISYLWYVEHYRTIMDMINSFYDQKKWMVGHFLTSINERNNRIGCTYASFFSTPKNTTIVMLSCNYPTTNIGTSTIYNSCKEPASKCTTGTDPKYKFLCSSAEKYDVSGKLKHVPYDGDGSEVFDNCGRQPELDHYDDEGGSDLKKVHNKTYPDIPVATEKPDGQVTTTSKPGNPTTKKPNGSTTDEPGGVPGLDDPDGNPNAGGEPDYSENEYDPIDDSSSRIFWHKTQRIVYVCFLVCSCFIKMFK